MQLETLLRRVLIFVFFWLARTLHSAVVIRENADIMMHCYSSTLSIHNNNIINLMMQSQCNCSTMAIITINKHTHSVSLSLSLPVPPY